MIPLAPHFWKNFVYTRMSLKSELCLVSLLKLLGAMSGIPEPSCCLRLAEGLSVKLLLVTRGLDLMSLELAIPSWEAGADIGLSLTEASLESEETRKSGESEKSCATCDWSRVTVMKGCDWLMVTKRACDWSIPG